MCRIHIHILSVLLNILTVINEVLIKVVTDPDSENGLLTVLETKQGRQEAPQAYYNQLRQAYFGAHNKPDLEEVNFKILFLRNLHHGVSHHLGIMACPRSMTIQQLHDLTQKAYNKQKMASKKGNKTSTLLNSVNKDSSLALDDTQLHHNTRVLHQEYRERDPQVHDSHQPNCCKNPWDQPRSSRNPKDKNNWKLHSAEYAQEQYSLPPEDMEQVMRQLNNFIQDKLNMDDYKIESYSL